MNNYEITHKGLKHKVKGEKLFTTMMNWCVNKGVDLNEIESCVLMPKKEVTPIKGLSNTLIQDLQFDFNLGSLNSEKMYEVRINLVSLNEKGTNNINRFFEKLLAKQQLK